MALSYYTNWSDNTAAGAITAYSTLFLPPSPLPEMFNFHEDPTFYNTGVNSIFDPNYHIFSDIVPPDGNVFLRSPDFQDPYSGVPCSATFSQNQLFPVEYATMLPEMGSYGGDGGGCYCGGGGVGLPEWYGGGGGGGYGEVEVRKKDDGNGGVSVSAQSMAARLRRRRISEKTQELGKLVPGGHKMNTAEMFQAAFKYVKFLQAQIGVLKVMPQLPESEEVMSNGEMQALVTCTLMQEKLYTVEKCIGPNTLESPSK